MKLRHVIYLCLIPIIFFVSIGVITYWNDFINTTLSVDDQTIYYHYIQPAITGFLIYTVIILLIEYIKAMNTEEMKKKKLAKLQKKIEKIKKD